MDMVNATATVIGYEVFRDILTLLLAIAAVAGATMYITIDNRLSKSLNEKLKTELNKNIAHFLLDISNSNWREYKNMNSNKLDLAIDTAERAQRYANELDERKPDNVWLLCKLKNNLAYLYAEKRDEKDLAYKYADYIKGNIDKARNDKERKDWKETYDFVQETKFP